MNTRSIKADLTKALKKGTVSPTLRNAITATVEALDKDDLNLAYHLTACKSFIVGEINPKDKVHAFQEDGAANEKAIGNSLYCILDGIHFQIAMAVDQMPSGMMVLSACGSTEMTHRGTHPIVKRIIAEQRAIYASANHK
jgi:hypothetical protein